MNIRKTLSILSLALLAAAPAALPDDHAEKRPAAEDAAVVKAQLPSYPLDKCAVSGEALGSMGDPIDLVVEGKLVRLCCKGCAKPVRKDPAKFVAKVDEAVVAAQAKSYPLKKCLISGEPVDSMGGPLNLVHGTRLVQLCCKGCKKAFEKDPAKHMVRVDAALIEAQKKSYSLKTCVVSEEPLEEPIDVLYGTQLVRLCCKGCKRGFDKEPTKFVAKLTKK